MAGDARAAAHPGDPRRHLRSYNVIDFSALGEPSINDDAPDALALVHQLEPLVDVGQRHGVRDHRIDLDLALHVPVDDFRHVGAAARAAKGRALPDAAGDQLEWAGCDLRAGRRDTDDDGLTPAAMAGFERLTHDGDVAGAVEGIVGAADLVGAALRHVDEMRHQIAADLLRIDEVGHAEALAPLLLGVVDIDADDHVRAGEPQSLDDIETDAAEPEHDAPRAGFHLGGIEDGTDAGGDAAADVADLVERSVLANLGDRDLRQHGEIRECGRAHVMVQLLAVEREARGAVGHDALTLRRADGGAQIGLARQTRRALPAFRRIERNDVVALLHAGHTRPHIDHDAGALVAEDGREQSFRIGAGERELVGVTDARG